ncbi:D-aminoacyl-tRNA deacylase [Ruania zhangjianzhongii]|uniref:D-aminoacyl-tRNA deacylase n=1 Tax=Ruania zhangjianzhongii TaxID=2603206 RepID=UPI0011C94D36|nr:D-aminoacyl-tRNA deacylase [Ruania zhangjianzhongii]
MRAVLQRVTHAQVSVAGEVVGSIGPGLVALVGVTHTDTEADAAWLARKIADLRILREETSVVDAGAEVLVVSQFTLYGQARKGRRPSWTEAAPGAVAEPLVDAVVRGLRDRGVLTATGSFGADMAVELVGDGPVTLVLETPTPTPT